MLFVGWTDELPLLKALSLAVPRPLELLARCPQLPLRLELLNRLAVPLRELAKVADTAEASRGNPDRPRDAKRAELGVGVEPHARGKDLRVDAAAGEIGPQVAAQRDAPRLPEHRERLGLQAALPLHCRTHEALPAFLRYYNGRRPHGGLDGDTPLARLRSTTNATAQRVGPGHGSHCEVVVFVVLLAADLVTDR